MESAARGELNSDGALAPEGAMKVSKHAGVSLWETEAGGQRERRQRERRTRQ